MLQDRANRSTLDVRPAWATAYGDRTRDSIVVVVMSPWYWKTFKVRCTSALF